MKRSDIINFLLSLVLSYASFPNVHFYYGFLGWFSFVPLLSILNNYPCYRQRFFICWFFFLIFFLALFWVYPFTLLDRLQNSLTLISFLGFYLVYPFILGSVFAVYSLKGVQKFVFGMPIAWVFMEYLLTQIPFGFPFNIATSQYSFAWIIQLSKVLGMSGISFVLMSTQVYLSLYLSELKIKDLISTIILVSTPFLFGGFSLFFQSYYQKDAPCFILIQPNLSWEDAYYSRDGNFLFKNVIKRLTDLCNRFKECHDNGIIVLPELSSSGFTLSSCRIQSFIQKITDQKFSLVMGIRHQMNNAVISVSHTGKILGIYHKNMLVPGFETHLDSNFLKKSPLILDSHDETLGMFICFDSLFPDISRQLVRAGASFLGCISFNTWLGNTNWPLLHMAQLPFRSVENGRPSFFLNNNGPSIATDSYGRILYKTALNSKDFITYCPSFSVVDTLYTQYGSKIFWSILFVILFLNLNQRSKC